MTAQEIATSTPGSAASRRLHIVSDDEDLIVTVDADGIVRVNEIVVGFTRFERKLFIYLANHQGTRVDKETLHKELYRDEEYKAQPSILKALLSKVRKKLEAAHPQARDLILSIGYTSMRMGRPVSIEEPTMKAEFTCHGAVIRINTYDEAFVDGEPFGLTPKEAKLCCMLAEKPGFVRTKHMIMRALYEKDTVIEDKILDVFVCKINGKFKKLGHAELLIKPAWGRGYYVGDLALDPAADPTALPAVGKKVKGTVVGKLSSEKLPENGHDLHWVGRKKATIVLLVEHEIVPLAYVLAKYPGLSVAEFVEWQEFHSTHGLKGLRVTKRQNYADAL